LPWPDRKLSHLLGSADVKGGKLTLRKAVRGGEENTSVRENTRVARKLGGKKVSFELRGRPKGNIC